MRRFAEVTAIAATGVFLIATGAVPTSDCAVESVPLQAATTCGPATAVLLTTKGDCSLLVGGGPGAGIPGSGHLTTARLDGGVRDGFVLNEYLATDGGNTTCTSGEIDAGAIVLRCGRNCAPTAVPDGGFESRCASTCEGVLNP